LRVIGHQRPFRIGGQRANRHASDVQDVFDECAFAQLVAG
jgi:hypothetical protein